MNRENLAVPLKLSGLYSGRRHFKLGVLAEFLRLSGSSYIADSKNIEELDPQSDSGSCRASG